MEHLSISLAVLTFIVGFAGSALMGLLLRFVFRGERFHKLSFALPILPFALTLLHRYALDWPVGPLDVLSYLGGSGLYFYNLKQKTKEPLLKPATIGFALVLGMNYSVAYFINLNYGRQSYVSECLQAGHSRIGFLSAVNSPLEEERYCQCIQEHLLPPKCYENLSLVWSASTVNTCKQEFEKAIANDFEFQSKFLQGTDSCISSILPRYSGLIYSKVRDTVLETQVRAILSTKDFQSIQASEDSKTAYANCFMGKILDACPNKSASGYNRCGNDSDDPRIDGYMAECSRLLTKK